MPRASIVGKTPRQKAQEALQAAYEAHVARWHDRRREAGRALEARSEARTRGEQVEPEWRLFPANLHEASGDPLALRNPDTAASLYSLDTASRPVVSRRKLAGSIYGSSLQSLIDVARRLRADRAVWLDIGIGADKLTLPHTAIPLENDRVRNVPMTIARSDRAAAEMAVALLATRGTFLGTHAPVPFTEAVDLVRKAINRRSASTAMVGDTGKMLRVVPSSGALVPMPDAPGTYLPVEGLAVPDSAFWRRRIEDGDVILA